MKNSNMCLITLIMSLFGSSLFAQKEPNTYLVIDYMKVEPEMHNSYLELEKIFSI